jgi:hypothetical protein
LDEQADTEASEVLLVDIVRVLLRQHNIGPDMVLEEQRDDRHL